MGTETYQKMIIIWELMIMYLPSVSLQWIILFWLVDEKWLLLNIHWFLSYNSIALVNRSLQWKQSMIENWNETERQNLYVFAKFVSASITNVLIAKDFGMCQWEKLVSVHKSFKIENFRIRGWGRTWKSSKQRISAGLNFW